jgi:hypothetical protein
LDHQELFDALMDEEVLRELLADPAARRKLLAALAGPGQVRTFWRRPAVLGLAASLFLLVTTSVVLLRRTGEPATMMAEHQEESVEKSTLAAGDSERSAPEKSPVAPSSPRPASPPARVVAAQKPAPVTSANEPVAQLAASEEAPAPMAEAAPQFRAARKAKARETSAAAGVMAQPAEVQAPAPTSVGSVMADAKLAKGEADELEGAAPGGAASIHAAPVLERLKDGWYRLRVTWGPGGHLYVLKRSGSAVSVLPPAATSSSSALFLFPLGDQDVIDLYVLTQAVGDPASLPATGDVPGYRRRIHPE